MEQYQLAYAEARALEDRLATIDTRARELLTAEGEAARGQANETLKLIEQTKSAAAEGELEFTDLFRETRQQLRDAEARMESARAAREQRERRAALIRRTIVVTLVVVAMVVIGFLFYLNRPTGEDPRGGD